MQRRLDDPLGTAVMPDTIASSDHALRALLSLRFTGGPLQFLLPAMDRECSLATLRRDDPRLSLTDRYSKRNSSCDGRPGVSRPASYRHVDDVPMAEIRCSLESWSPTPEPMAGMTESGCCKSVPESFPLERGHPPLAVQGDGPASRRFLR